MTREGLTEADLRDIERELKRDDFLALPENTASYPNTIRTLIAEVRRLRDELSDHTAA